MYSKTKGMQPQEFALTPPPGYDGSRFRRRSDGRDDAFPIYPENPQRYRQSRKPKEECSYCREEPPVHNDEDDLPCTCCEEEPAPCAHVENKKDDLGIISFIEGLKSEELLLIALIVLLCTRDSGQGLDTVLILALLLCM